LNGANHWEENKTFNMIRFRTLLDPNYKFIDFNPVFNKYTLEDLPFWRRGLFQVIVHNTESNNVEFIRMSTVNRKSIIVKKIDQSISELEMKMEFQYTTSEGELKTKEILKQVEIINNSFSFLPSYKKSIMFKGFNKL
jgi:hypothetical protein